MDGEQSFGTASKKLKNVIKGFNLDHSRQNYESAEKEIRDFSKKFKSQDVTLQDKGPKEKIIEVSDEDISGVDDNNESMSDLFSNKVKLILFEMFNKF